MSTNAGTELPVCPPGYAIRDRLPGDDAQLVTVENAACLLFADHGYPELAEDGFPDVVSFREMIGDGAVFVAAGANDAPVGYAVAIRLGDWSHLRELSVHPNHGRQGLGRALVRAVIAAAQNTGAAGVSLSTFRDIPFNRPFYETLGFREMPLADAPLALAEAFRREVPDGIDPAKRVLMILPLLPPGKP
ncbi:MAG: GNAT family N-acetyltransferase [Rhizobiaceae bacterium]|nr:GNAT family N-acetyltransferase [Rhizobiaceae bacterium]